MLGSGFSIGLLIGASLIGAPLGMLVYALCVMAKDPKGIVE